MQATLDRWPRTALLTRKRLGAGRRQEGPAAQARPQEAQAGERVPRLSQWDAGASSGATLLPHVTPVGAGRNDFTLLPSPTCPVGHRPCTEYRDLRSRYIPAHLQRDGVPPLTSRPTADSLANEPLQALTWLSDGLNTITSRTTPGLLCLYLLRLRKRWSAMSYAATENPPVFFPTCHR